MRWGATAAVSLVLAVGLSPGAAARRHRAPEPLPEEIQAGRCDDLEPATLIRALEAELPSLRKRSQQGGPTLRLGRRRLSLAAYVGSTLTPLLAEAQKGKAALCEALRTRFTLLPLTHAGSGHFSVYYHPVVRGSRLRQGMFRYPLYRRPEGLLSGLPTAQILAGDLDGKALELLYVESLGTALNIHIEGSVTVQLVEGGEVNLTTDGHNGHPYVNPFKLARADGVIPSDQKAPPGTSRTRAFFDEHEDLLRTYWAKNAHYVFFKETPLRGTGKFGELVAGRSIAVDPAHVPLGALLWLRTELARVERPASAAGPPTAAQTTNTTTNTTTTASQKTGESGKDVAVRYQPIARLALAQDTGAAIRGNGRVDLFVGSGAEAQVAATLTSRPGDLFVVVARQPSHRPKGRRRSG